MKVLISPQVHRVIENFYEIALQKHITLDEVTAYNKMNRLYDALESLSRYARIHPKARLKKEWIKNGYYECVFEDFHFAYFIAEDENSEEVLIVEDACHSLLYRNDE